MIDTHSHIYGHEYDDDREEVIARASVAGVTKHLLANVDSSTIEQMCRCKAEFHDVMEMAMGLHPTSVNGNYRHEMGCIEDALRAGRYVAIGEIGMDLYWDRTFEREQEEVLAVQADWALSLDLPLILHVRKAYAETFKVLQRFKGKPLRGVFHCFGGGVEEAKKAVSMGFYLGIGGVVTYKNSNLGDVIKSVGLQHIVLETDAPYLSPVPNRGKRNEPANLTYIRERIASVFHENEKIVDELTTANARTLFNI